MKRVPLPEAERAANSRGATSRWRLADNIPFTNFLTSKRAYFHADALLSQAHDDLAHCGRLYNVVATCRGRITAPLPPNIA